MAWGRASLGWHRAKKEQNAFSQVPRAKKEKKEKTPSLGGGEMFRVDFLATCNLEAGKTFLLADTNCQQFPFLV